MTFEIIIWKFVISFSIFREEEPKEKEIEYSVFYNLRINEDGEVVKIPMY